MSQQALVLRQATIDEGDKALSHREKVLVRLKGAELALKVHRRVSLNDSDVWPDPEWVLYPLARRTVHDIQQGPVDLDGEGVAIRQCHLSGVAITARFSESKVDKI